MNRCVAIAAALAGALALNLVLTSPAPAASCAWQVVPVPNVSDANELLGVDALSPSDVWAVGLSFVGVTAPIIEHWNGQAWTVVPSPSIGNGSELYGVSAASQSDIWAVGFYLGADRVTRTLVEHWDGRTWTIVPSPNPPRSHDSELRGVVAISTSDVWAVGDAGADNFTEHWDGHKWTIVPTAPTLSTFLESVSAVSSSDVWAVGIDSDHGSSRKAFAEHWDGHVWTIVRPRVAKNHDNVFIGVSAISPSNVWAVGSGADHNTGNPQTLTQNWNGHAWVYVPSPNPPNTFNGFEDVSATSKSDVWAVGTAYSLSDASIQTIIEHWDGSAWSLVPSPNPGFQNVLLRASADSPSDAWAVGYYYKTRFNSQPLLLVEHWKC